MHIRDKYSRTGQKIQKQIYVPYDSLVERESLAENKNGYFFLGCDSESMVCRNKADEDCSFLFLSVMEYRSCHIGAPPAQKSGHTK